MTQKLQDYWWFGNSCHSPSDGKFCSNGKALSPVGVDLRDLAKFHGEEMAKLQHVVEIIDKIHGVPSGYPDAKVEIFSEMSGAQGSYEPGAKIVKLVENGAFPSSTLAHELGHHFTLALAGEGKVEFYSKLASDPELKAWHNAVKATPQFLAFHNLEGASSGATQDSKEYASYLKDPRELFARSYSQWIATKSGDPVLLAEHKELAKKASGLYQWSDSEFEPISKALDGYFAAKGWLR